MSILEKIEEIRKKPENIRMRYVISLVAISMFFILLIWIISLKGSFIQNRSNQNATESSDIINKLKEGGEAVNDVKNEINNMKNFQNEINNQQK